MESITIEFTKNNQGEFEILIDQVSIFSNYSYKQQAEILEKAIVKIENDLTLIIRNYGGLKELSGFLWCYTYKVHRDDGIKDTVLDYFALEVVQKLAGNYKVSIIDRFGLSIGALTRMKAFFKEAKIESVSLKKTVKLKVRLKKTIGPMSYIFGHVKNTFFSKVKNNSTVPAIDTLVYKAIRKGTTRFRGFLEEPENTNAFILDENLQFIKSPNGKINRIAPFSVTLFAVAFYKALQLHFWGFRKLLESNSLVESLIKEQSIFQSVYLLYRFEIMKQILGRLNPKQVIVSTSFSDPNNRMFMEASKTMNIPITVLSCRPFLSKYRPEDRIIEEELSVRYNALSLDKFVVFNENDRNYVRSFPYLSDKVVMFSPENNKGFKKTTRFNNGVLILFAHQSYNKYIIELLKRIIPKDYKGRIFYREHPNVKLTTLELIKLKQIGNVKCLNQNNWHNMIFEKVVTFTSNSTAVFEAQKRGCDVLWLTYLSINSLQFYELFSNSGTICNNEVEFEIGLKDYLTKNM
ncbi:MAG: hypothetical protein ACPGRC_04020 [Salibacteraceae bacterium]